MNASRTTVRSASPAKLLATAALAALSLTVAGVAATPAAAAPSGTGSTSRGPLPTASSNGWAGAGIKYHQSQTQKQQPNTGSPNTGSPNTVSPSTTSSYRSAPPGYPQGIDVSSNDHDYGTPPDWPTLAANGYTFAYVKATEGTTYTNPYFATDYAAAKQNGLDVGAYVFARPDSPDPAAQADYLYQQMKWTADGKTLPPMIDMEWPYFSGYNACYNLTVDQMVNWLTTFVKELRGKIGVAPVIYTAPSWWQQCTNNSAAFTSSPLFVSSCATTPPAVPGWSTWTFWQYDIKACGDDPPNDQDVFNGTVTQLNNLAYPLGNSCFPPMVGDTNGDHHADTVLMCHRPDNSIGLFTSLGDATGAFGTFTSGYTLPPNAWDWNSFRTISGDFNGDGRADVAAMYHFSTGAISMCT
ncbi:MAG TPA: GH25 family lysozyme, partial [Micromonosporaceae bacterium]